MKRLSATLLTLCAFTSLGVTACSSNTVKKLNEFADKVCKCSDAACANTVQAEYLKWWEDNRRARGSEGDRKDVEKALQRYAECHGKLVMVEAPPAPKLDLNRPGTEAQPAPLAIPAKGTEIGSAVEPGESPSTAEAEAPGGEPAKETQPGAVKAPVSGAETNQPTP